MYTKTVATNVFPQERLSYQVLQEEFEVCNSYCSSCLPCCGSVTVGDSLSLGGTWTFLVFNLTLGLGQVLMWNSAQYPPKPHHKKLTSWLTYICPLIYHSGRISKFFDQKLVGKLTFILKWKTCLRNSTRGAQACWKQSCFRFAFLGRL